MATKTTTITTTAPEKMFRVIFCSLKVTKKESEVNVLEMSYAFHLIPSIHSSPEKKQISFIPLLTVVWESSPGEYGDSGGDVKTMILIVENGECENHHNQRVPYAATASRATRLLLDACSSFSIKRRFMVGGWRLFVSGGLVATTVDEDYSSVVVWLQPRWMKTICQWWFGCNHGG